MMPVMAVYSRFGACKQCGKEFVGWSPKAVFCGLECANKGKVIANRKGRDWLPCSMCLRKAGISHKKMRAWFPMVSDILIYQSWKAAGFEPGQFKSFGRFMKSMDVAKVNAAKQEERARRKAEKAAKPKVTAMDRYYANHEESKRHGAEYAKLRYHTVKKHEPIHKTRQSIRNAVRKIVKLCGQSRKQWRSEVYLGCTFDEAREHISRQFKRGMTWENHGSAWEIDHIMPLSKFDLTKPEHVRQATHYTNLQPLWKAENRMKSDKIINHQAVLL